MRKHDIVLWGLCSYNMISILIIIKLIKQNDFFVLFSIKREQKRDVVQWSSLRHGAISKYDHLL